MLKTITGIITVSTSPDNTLSYPAYLLELESRRTLLTGEYLKILELLEDDLNTENIEKFELHLQAQDACFRRLKSCRKAGDGAGLKFIESELDKRLKIQHQRIESKIKERVSSLQTRLKKGNFRKDRNRIFALEEHTSSFVDFSC